MDDRGVVVPRPVADAYYQDLDARNLYPIWEVIKDLVPLQPRTPCMAHLWRYADIRPLMMKTREMIDVKGAERRALVLENPGIRGRCAITQTLYASYQMVLPGEVAANHRHVPTALRFVIEGSGAYTAVAGEKAIMRPGDLVITPNWAWHDHGNESDEPIVWLDGLDVPLVATLDTCFKEYADKDSQTLTRPAGDSLARFGQGLVPVDYRAPDLASPVFHFPYDRTREALETMRRTSEWDPYHGLKMRFVNPSNGDHVIPTIGCFMQLLPKGMTTLPYRSTDGTVYVGVEGRGRTFIGETAIEWSAHDVFVVPSWQPHHHVAEDDAVLFSFSDRPVHEKLGMWREQRGNA
ncbi:MAG: gentisate 1,2-dioxygenase [Alphaproteobacteria bacterium]